MIEVYRGSANAWECDEMGHMNVRFYVAKMMEGLAEFAHQAGLRHVFRPRANSTLAPRDQHIRFLREALAGRPFVMHACALEVTDTSVLIYQQIDHASGDPCATFRTWVDHVDVDMGTPFPWTPKTRAALETLKGEAPAAIGPRSIDMSAPPRPVATLAQADAVSALTIGRGVFQPAECDLNGRLMPELFIGRVSDSVSNLLWDWRQTLAAAAGRGEQLPRSGTAVLEYRVVYRRWPRTGDRFVIRSSLGQVKEKVNTYVHWILDPDTGEAWCTAEAVAVALNLDTRKIIPASPDQLKALKKHVPSGLTV